MEYKVSIIVPVYNGEKYFKRCVDSVLNQSYKNIEIILVDDGSTDKSFELMQAISDHRVKIYTKCNKGVSSARNFAMEKSTGDLIMFVDIDDYIDKNMVKKLVDKIKDKNDSFVLCGNVEIFENYQSERRVFSDEDKRLDKYHVMKSIATGKAGLVCCKLISFTIIKNNNIFFDEKLKVGEDQLFFLEVASKCNNFGYVDEYLYFYDRRNDNSATMKYQDNLLENFLIIQDATEKIFKDCNLQSYEDKKLLNEKIFDWFMICIFNDVKNLGIFKATKNIKFTVLNVENKFQKDILSDKESIYLLIQKNINSRKFLYAFKIWVMVKMILVKNGVR